MQPRELDTSAIVVAHPGHELRAYRWMELHRPVYFCLTEGSGGGASSRLESTTRLLEKLGCRSGTIFGRYTDKDVYRFLLEGRVEVFADLANELANALIAERVARVVGDAVEGFNPTHDVCRFIIDAAVDIVHARTGRVLANYDFVLDSNPNDCPPALRSSALVLDLDDAALERKIGAALDYPELGDEVTAALERFGRSAFAREFFRLSTPQVMLQEFEHTSPAYERYGQMRVSEHRYSEVIRYRDHVLPALQAIAGAGATSSSSRQTLKPPSSPRA